MLCSRLERRLGSNMVHVTRGEVPSVHRFEGKLKVCLTIFSVYWWFTVCPCLLFVLSQASLRTVLLRFYIMPVIG